MSRKDRKDKGKREDKRNRRDREDSGESRNDNRKMSMTQQRQRPQLQANMIKSIKPRTDGQHKYVETMKKHPITLCIGPAGSGKTQLAVALAVEELIAGKFEKIILTRPAIEAAGEQLGFLPGTALEKLDPYMIPLYDSLDKVVGKFIREKMMEDGTIEIVPLAYMRGRTLDKAFIVLDESQNCSSQQILMILTRLGADSKIVVTGDLNQSDISYARDNSRNQTRNGLEDAILRFSNDDDIAVVCLRLCDIQRHPLITHIIRAYELGLPETTMEEIYRSK